MSRLVVPFPFGWPEPLNIVFKDVSPDENPVDVSDFTTSWLVVDLVGIDVVITGQKSPDNTSGWDYTIPESLPPGVWRVSPFATIGSVEYPLGNFYLNIYDEGCDCHDC